MGARLVVEFDDNYDSNNPMVYLHWGGERVDEIYNTMDMFFEKINELEDKRLMDAAYLAAKLVVWAWDVSGNDDLNFLGIGIVTSPSVGDGHVIVNCTTEPGMYRINKAIDLQPVSTLGQ